MVVVVMRMQAAASKPKACSNLQIPCECQVAAI